MHGVCVWCGCMVWVCVVYVCVCVSECVIVCVSVFTSVYECERVGRESLWVDQQTINTGPLCSLSRFVPPSLCVCVVLMTEWESRCVLVCVSVETFSAQNAFRLRHQKRRKASENTLGSQ